eukprot:5153542-Prorocentrum_lima.AAC.1
MTSSLVGSEMCIRDRDLPLEAATDMETHNARGRSTKPNQHNNTRGRTVSYTHLTLPTICSV